MKQGKKYTTIILWILLALIIGYLCYSVFSSLYDPLTTTTAVPYEVGAGYYSRGYVVRDESVLRSPYDITVLTASEGARVAAGTPVATGFLSENTQERQSQIASLQQQLEQLNYAYQYASSAADQAELDGEILTDLTSLVRFLNRRDMNSVEDLSPELKGLILRYGSTATDAQAIQGQISTVQAALDALQFEVATDIKTVTATDAGYFSGTVDGYESVLTPEMLDNLTVQDFQNISPDKIPNKACAKLIKGDTWYFVTTIPSAELEDVSRGDTVQISFARDFYEQISMKVVRIGSNEAGYRLLVLSSDRYMQNITLLREQSADIIFRSVSGIRVPKEAVHVDEDGLPGVFTLEGARAKWKNISILHDNGESYVVESDRSSTNNLWPGDEIIVTAKNLYDGKVAVAK